MVGRRNAALSRTNRKRFHLGHGEYEWPEQIAMRPVGRRGAAAEVQVWRVSVDYGRVLILGAVDEVEPRVLDELGQEPLRTLKASGWDRQRDGPLTLEVVRAKARLSAFRASLAAWSSRWHVTDDWCLEIALSTLMHKPGGARLAWFELLTHFDGRTPAFRPPFPAPLGLRPWNIVGERRGDYIVHAQTALNPKWHALNGAMVACLDSISGRSPEERDRLLASARALGDRMSMLHIPKLSAASEQLLSDYLDRVESAARGAGLVPRPAEFRQPRVFRWLAGYQVCGWSPRQIARATCVYPYSEAYPNAILHGIRRLAGHIGLTLRCDRPRSPRGANLACLIDELRAALSGERRRPRSIPPAPLPSAKERRAYIRELIRVLKETGYFDDVVGTTFEAQAGAQRYPPNGHGRQMGTVTADIRR
jgi:hypothetical protein